MSEYGEKVDDLENYEFNGIQQRFLGADPFILITIKGDGIEMEGAQMSLPTAIQLLKEAQRAYKTRLKELVREQRRMRRTGEEV